MLKDPSFHFQATNSLFVKFDAREPNLCQRALVNLHVTIWIQRIQFGEVDFRVVLLLIFSIIIVAVINQERAQLRNLYNPVLSINKVKHGVLQPFTVELNLDCKKLK